METGHKDAEKSFFLPLIKQVI